MKQLAKSLVGLAVVIVSAVVVWTAVRPSSEITLSNGTEVRYLAAVRASQPFTTERWIYKMGRRYLPAIAQGWIPEAWSVDAMPFGWSNSISIQLLVKGPANSTPRLPNPLLFVAEDSSGFRFPPCYLNVRSDGRSGSLHSLVASDFPRRERRFRIHLTDRFGTALGTLEVDNPLAESFREWSPSPLPIRETNGPVVLSLEAVSPGVSFPGNYLLNPQWSVETTNAFWNGAVIRVDSVSDATGNACPFPGLWVPAFETEGISPLSPAEPAWKLSASMHRVRRTDFADTERAVATNLNLPSAGEFVVVRSAVPSVGVTIVGVFGGIGSIDPEAVKQAVRDQSFRLKPLNSDQSAKPWITPAPFLRIDVKGLQDSAGLIATVFDDQGGKTTITNRHLVTSLSSNGPTFSLEGPVITPNGTRPVAIEFAAGNPLRFEFFVDPKVIRPERPTTP